MNQMNRKMEDEKTDIDYGQISTETIGLESRQPEMIWLYAADPKTTNRVLRQLLFADSKGFEVLRLRLGLGFDKPLIPVFPETKNRTDYIKYLCSLKSLDAVLVVAGSLEDQNDKAVQRLYDGAAVWLHPKERQYYIDTMNVEEAPPYKEVKALKNDWCEYLLEFFDFDEIIELS